MLYLLSIYFLVGQALEWLTSDRSAARLRNAPGPKPSATGRVLGWLAVVLLWPLLLVLAAVAAVLLVVNGRRGK